MTRTDRIRSAISEELEQRRRELDADSALCTVTVMVQTRLMVGRRLEYRVTEKV
ncbi:MAG: hypothetical protein U0531_07875 [Dehalococcoidia bacterium]